MLSCFSSVIVVLFFPHSSKILSEVVLKNFGSESISVVLVLLIFSSAYANVVRACLPVCVCVRVWVCVRACVCFFSGLVHFNV